MAKRATKTPAGNGGNNGAVSNGSVSNGPVAPENWLQSAWNGLGIGAPGVWLAILYIVFCFFVVFSLSAHQLQYQINTLKTEKGSEDASVWELDQLHSQWNQLKQDIESQSKELVILRQERAELSKEQNAESLSVDGDRIKCLTALRDINDRMKEDHESYKYKTDEDVRCDNATFSWISRSIESVKAGIDADDAAAIDHLAIKSGLVREQKDIVFNLADRRTKLELGKQRLAEVVERIFTLEGNLVAFRKSADDLLENSSLGSKAGDFLNALTYLNGKEDWPFIPAFSEMPTDMLTIILVMSMGALGGTISLTRSYLTQKKTSDDDKIGGAYYAFRPFLGAITALSVFILAKAGVLIISTPAQGAEGATLSPYFISFIGIISGMLADSALDTIQRAGNNWFKNSQATPDRWVYGLGDALIGDKTVDKAVQDKTLSENIELLSETLNVSNKTIKKWIDEKEQVPADRQAIIAAFVRKPPRELFSGIGGDLDVSDMRFAADWDTNTAT